MPVKRRRRDPKGILRFIGFSAGNLTLTLKGLVF